MYLANVNGCTVLRTRRRHKQPPGRKQATFQNPPVMSSFARSTKLLVTNTSCACWRLRWHVNNTVPTSGVQHRQWYAVARVQQPSCGTDRASGDPQLKEVLRRRFVEEREAFQSKFRAKARALGKYVGREVHKLGKQLAQSSEEQWQAEQQTRVEFDGARFSEGFDSRPWRTKPVRLHTRPWPAP